MDDVTVTLPRSSAHELDRLLTILERADSRTSGLSAEEIRSARLTDEGLGLAHAAIHQAIG